MNFSSNKTPIEIIKEGAFGGTYFRDIYSGINGTSFDQLKNIDAKLQVSDYYDKNLNKYKVKTGPSLIKTGLIKQILMAGFSGISGTGQVED